MEALQFRELLEIKFKTFHMTSFDEMRPRWVVGQIIDCSCGTWPLVQLSDGQLTELRPYMEWRRLDRLAAHRHERSSHSPSYPLAARHENATPPTKPPC
jgi:hypothetical protein